jgi:hypothetical protein
MVYKEVVVLEEKAASLTVNLSKWQQNMLKDMFGVKTTKLDIIEEFRQWVMYRPPEKEVLSSLGAQRMYLEDDQKAQIAKILGMKAAKMCNYIELDPEVIVKYAAMQRHPVLYGGLPVSE